MGGLQCFNEYARSVPAPSCDSEKDSIDSHPHPIHLPRRIATRHCIPNPSPSLAVYFLQLHPHHASVFRLVALTGRREASVFRCQRIVLYHVGHLCLALALRTVSLHGGEFQGHGAVIREQFADFGAVILSPALRVDAYVGRVPAVSYTDQGLFRDGGVE